jgi:predicted secreted protein
MSRAQIGIFLTGAPAFALVLAVISAVGAGRLRLPQDWNADAPHLAAGACVAIAFTLLWAVLDVSLGRFFSPHDIDGAGLTEASASIKLKRAILQNTLEQVVLAGIAYFGLVLSAPPALAALPPFLAALFILGRVLFRFGYRFGAPGRAPGFALCFAPTIIAYGMILSFWLR